eukprot:TRINITY_DN16950_c0_g1_i1.p1 TRINITY_DN16950_c0_g1~~TRINITY_DN16950_c0_g1_i1.p1  ORF type:complete len:627 (-),score=79.44 TRINITY_DN16950_c0_g1_i1:202-2082(-)
MNVGAFEAMDRNRDGAVPRVEFNAAFDAMDRNRDGVVTRAEFDEALNMKPGMGGAVAAGGNFASAAVNGASSYDAALQGLPPYISGGPGYGAAASGTYPAPGGNYGQQYGFGTEPAPIGGSVGCIPAARERGFSGTSTSNGEPVAGCPPSVGAINAPGGYALGANDGLGGGGQERVERLVRERTADGRESYVRVREIPASEVEAGRYVVTEKPSYAFPKTGSFVAEAYEDGRPMYQAQSYRGQPNSYSPDPRDPRAAYANGYPGYGGGYEREARSLSPMPARSHSPMGYGHHSNGYSNGYTNGYPGGMNGYTNGYNGYAGAPGNGYAAAYGPGNGHSNVYGNAYGAAQASGYGNSYGNSYGAPSYAGARAPSPCGCRCGGGGFPTSGSFIAEPFAEGAPSLQSFSREQSPSYGPARTASFGPPPMGTASVLPAYPDSCGAVGAPPGGNSYAMPMGSYANLGYGGGGVNAYGKGSFMPPTQSSFMAGPSTGAYGSSYGASPYGGAFNAGLGAGLGGGLGGGMGNFGGGYGMGASGAGAAAFPDLALGASLAGACGSTRPESALDNKAAAMVEMERLAAERPGRGRSPTPRVDAPSKAPAPAPSAKLSARPLSEQPPKTKKTKGRGCC